MKSLHSSSSVPAVQVILASILPDKNAEPCFKIHAQNKMPAIYTRFTCETNLDSKMPRFTRYLNCWNCTDAGTGLPGITEHREVQIDVCPFTTLIQRMRNHFFLHAMIKSFSSTMFARLQVICSEAHRYVSDCFVFPLRQNAPIHMAPGTLQREPDP